MKYLAYVLVLFIVIGAVYAGAMSAVSLYPYRPMYLSDIMEEWSNIEFEYIDWQEIRNNLEYIKNSKPEREDGDIFTALIDSGKVGATTITYICKVAFELVCDSVENAILVIRFVSTFFTLKPALNF